MSKTKSCDSAEQAVLGCMLRHPDTIPEVVPLLREEDFRTDGNRKVFAALVTLWDRGQPVDLVTAAEELIQRGQFEDVGGAGLLGELWNAAPTSGNLAHYARIVKQYSTRRGLAQVGRELVALAEKPTGSSEEMLGEAEQRVLGLTTMGVTGGARPLRELVNETYDRLDERARRGREAGGLSTGFPSLDSILVGLQDGELTIVGARPSVGKTALAVSLARYVVCEVGLSVLFVSLEQSRLELTERLLCCQGKVNGHALRRGVLNAEETRKLAQAGDVLREAPLFVDDQSNQRMVRVAAAARRLKARHGLGLVILDYVQLIEPDNPKANRQEQVASISRRLKGLARELNIPVVALAQLNRASEDRPGRRPRLSDLRESGAIEADADNVLLLHRGERPEILEIIVAKQRNGPTGEVLLKFAPQFMHLEDAAWSFGEE